MCTQKVSTLLKSVSVSGRPSVYPITLQKSERLTGNFFAQVCLMNISVEFKDEKDPSRNDWVIEKIVIHPWGGGGTGFFFQKNYFSQNYLKHIWIDSVFKADSEYYISFESNCSFLTKSCLKKVSKCTKTVSWDQSAEICDMSQMTSGFGVS